MIPVKNFIVSSIFRANLLTSVFEITLRCLIEADADPNKRAGWIIVKNLINGQSGRF